MGNDIALCLAFHVAALVILPSARVPIHTGVNVCTPLAVPIVIPKLVSVEVANVCVELVEPFNEVIAVTVSQVSLLLAPLLCKNLPEVPGVKAIHAEELPIIRFPVEEEIETICPKAEVDVVIARLRFVNDVFTFVLKVPIVSEEAVVNIVAPCAVMTTKRNVARSERRIVFMVSFILE